MLIDFEDKLGDGCAIYFSADEFESPEEDVGFGGAVTNFWVQLDGTGFPVSLTDAEEERLTNKAFERWLEDVSSDWEY